MHDVSEHKENAPFTIVSPIYGSYYLRAMAPPLDLIFALSFTDVSDMEQLIETTKKIDFPVEEVCLGFTDDMIPLVILDFERDADLYEKINDEDLTEEKCWRQIEESLSAFSFKYVATRDIARQFTWSEGCEKYSPSEWNRLQSLQNYVQEELDEMLNDLLKLD